MKKGVCRQNKSILRICLIIPGAIVICVVVFLLIMEVALLVPTHQNNIRALKKQGYFENIQVEKGDATWDTPPSWRHPIMNLIKTGDCVYGQASLSRESADSMMDQYDWTEWSITEQEWDDRITRFDGFEQEVVHPTMLEFDKLKEIYVGNSFLISAEFERECMNSTPLKPCHCYYDQSTKTLYYYIYHD